MQITDIPKGASNAISRRELMDLWGMGDRGVRATIEQLRQHHAIISTSKKCGYYRPTNLAEIDEYIASMTGRAKKILFNLNQAKRIREDFIGQLKLIEEE